MHKLIEASVFAAIGVLVFASLLIPVVDDATTTTDKFNNTGYFFMEKYGTDTDLTISWNPADPKKITVNDVEYSPNTPVNQFVNLAIGDNWFYRYADGGANTYIQVSYGGSDMVTGNNNETTNVVLTASNGIATITKGTTVKTVPYTEIYAISGNAGDYVMKNANESVTVAGDTEFIGLGVTSLGTGRAILKVTGDVDNGATVDVIGSIPSESTISNVNVSAISMVGHNGYALSDVTFTVTMDAVDYPATYSYFIVPSEVTLERSVHADEPTREVLEIMPLILIAGLIIGVLGYAVYSRIE